MVSRVVRSIIAGRAQAENCPMLASHLLDRRAFLQTAAGGLGSIALVHLFAQRGLLADPIRPRIRPEAPLAPRTPHFAAKAKRVLQIFCSGAVSHVDTFDYKPEL